METGEFDRLYNSINSSFPPSGPVVRNSLITTRAPGGGEVFVAVKVFVGRLVFVGVSVTVLVLVDVAVSVEVLVGVHVGGGAPHKLRGDEKFCGLLGVIN
jgi:hypothetical protein